MFSHPMVSCLAANTCVGTVASQSFCDSLKPCRLTGSNRSKQQQTLILDDYPTFASFLAHIIPNHTLDFNFGTFAWPAWLTFNMRGFFLIVGCPGTVDKCLKMLKLIKIGVLWA